MDRGKGGKSIESAYLILRSGVVSRHHVLRDVNADTLRGVLRQSLCNANKISKAGQRRAEPALACDSGVSGRPETRPRK